MAAGTRRFWRPLLRDRGKLYAAHVRLEAAVSVPEPRDGGFRAKLASAPAVYDNVYRSRRFGFPDELEIAPAGSADLVVTFRNVHNWVQEGYGPPNAAELAFKAIFTALKPGGVLGVVDHRWPDPATEDPRARNGYISEQRVVEYAEAAGFELAGRSDVNATRWTRTTTPKGFGRCRPISRSASAIATSISRSASRIASR